MKLFSQQSARTSQAALLNEKCLLCFPELCAISSWIASQKPNRTVIRHFRSSQTIRKHFTDVHWHTKAWRFIFCL